MACDLGNLGFQGSVSRKSRYLFRPWKAIYVRDVYMEDSNFFGFES